MDEELVQQVAKLQENEALERQGTRAPEGVRQTRKDNLSGWQWQQKPHHQRQGEYTGCHRELHQCRICLSWDLLGTWRRKDGTWIWTFTASSTKAVEDFEMDEIGKGMVVDSNKAGETDKKMSDEEVGLNVSRFSGVCGTRCNPTEMDTDL